MRRRISRAAEYSLHSRRSSLYTPSRACQGDRPSINSISVSRSCGRKWLRPAAAATNTSGSAISVHPVGTEVCVPSSRRKNTLCCFQVCRTETNSNVRPNHGWNGWVTLMVCAPPSGSGGVDGVVQFRRRELLRHPPARAARRAPLGEPSTAGPVHLRVDRGLVQPKATPQLLPDVESRGLRSRSRGMISNRQQLSAGAGKAH
jgi:hypothetical protein